MYSLWQRWERLHICWQIWLQGAFILVIRMVCRISILKILWEGAQWESLEDWNILNFGPKNIAVALQEPCGGWWTRKSNIHMWWTCNCMELLWIPLVLQGVSLCLRNTSNLRNLLFIVDYSDRILDWKIIPKLSCAEPVLPHKVSWCEVFEMRVLLLCSWSQNSCCYYRSYMEILNQIISSFVTVTPFLPRICND